MSNQPISHRLNKICVLGKDLSPRRGIDVGHVFQDYCQGFTCKARYQLGILEDKIISRVLILATPLLRKPLAGRASDDHIWLFVYSCIDVGLQGSIIDISTADDQGHITPESLTTIVINFETYKRI